MRFRLLLALTLLSIHARAQDCRSALLARYERAALGAKYKYVDGLLANRGTQFELLNKAGQRMDLSLDRSSFKVLFESALEVRLKTTLDQLLSSTSRSARCQVTQCLEVDRPDPRSRSVETSILKVRLIDDWERDDQGWQLRRSQILSQDYGTK